MKIEFTIDFRLTLEDQIRFIAKDKPKAARSFKSALIKSIKKDLLAPLQFKKSKYFKMNVLENMFSKVIQ
jgi:hypothetical protein